MDKVQKIREEVVRLKSQLLRGSCSSQVAMETRCKEEAYNEVLAILDTLQEEPAPKVLDDMPLDPNIQYASREIGIKAHAEDYSFNIESELFQQLNKEQQKLWRKEIEQACMSGGYCGLNLGLDKRYDKEEPVSIDFEQELYKAFGQVKDFTLGMRIAKRFYEMGKNSQEPVSEDLEEASLEYFKQALKDGDKTKLDAFKAGAKWQKEQFEKDCTNLCNGIATAKGIAVAMAYDKGVADTKEQMMAKAIRGRVSVDVKSNYHSLIYGCWDMDNALKNCNDGDKVKIVIIKED